MTSLVSEASEAMLLSPLTTLAHQTKDPLKPL